MKKRSEATQTLRAGCNKADPQTNTHTNRQGRSQYTAQLSAQCNNNNNTVSYKLRPVSRTRLERISKTTTKQTYHNCFSHFPSVLRSVCYPNLL